MPLKQIDAATVMFVPPSRADSFALRTYMYADVFLCPSTACMRAADVLVRMSLCMGRGAAGRACVVRVVRGLTHHASPVLVHVSIKDHARLHDAVRQQSVQEYMYIRISL